MNTQLRIGNFSPDAPAMNVSVDGDLLLEDISFGTLGDYMDLDDIVDTDADMIDIEIMPATGGDAVIAESLSIEDDQRYTLMAVGMLDELELLTLTDEQRSIEDGDARLRFVNTTVDAPAVDLMADDTLVFETIEFGEIRSAVPVDANTWDIDVRVAGEHESLVSLDGMTLDDMTSYTLISTGLIADDGMDLMLVSDYVWTDDRAVISQ